MSYSHALKVVIIQRIHYVPYTKQSLEIGSDSMKYSINTLRKNTHTHYLGDMKRYEIIK